MTSPPPLPRLGRRAILVVAGLVILIMFILPASVRFMANWYWFGEIGFRTILTSEITTRAILLVVAALAAFGILYANVLIAQRRARPLPAVMGDMISIAPNLPPVAVRRLATGIAIFLSILTALTVSTGWLTVLRYLNGVPFGVTDPIFGRDVGFYVNTLPFLSGILAFLSALTIVSVLLSAGVYLANGAIAATGQQIRVARVAGVHVAVLLAVFLVLTALQIWFLSIPQLLFSTTGPFVGASYSDVNARLPGLRIAALVALISAGMVVYGIVRRKRFRFFATAVALYVGVSLLGRALIPAAVQRLIVAPTELTKEMPYLGHHIDATRRAWGIDSVATRDARGEANLTPASLRQNVATVENVRLWDRDPLRQTFSQIQEIRTYYEFVSIDDDRYWIDGRYRQVHLSPRELNSASLPTRSFINEHLTFTHGMGVTLAPVNQVTEEGLPVLFIKDLPPVSNVSLRLTRPGIYFGEATDSYAIVGTKQREFDYPAGDANIFATYAGRGGVSIKSIWRRALLAWHFRSLKILLSGDITNESKILYGRNIVERASRALPFVRLDRDPYMVVTDSGQLKWILDAYTTSNAYPYSQRLADGTSYMRNSVKVVVDAYDGTVTAYLADPSDPLARTWANVFPGIFQPIASMPADLRNHVRYPEDLFRMQAGLYATYHMTEPEAFYHREDQWQIPTIQQGQSESAFMRRIVMRLPEEDSAEFIFMSPFTPRNKDNLAAWLVARNDGDHYGDLLVYRFPKQSLVYGPQQVINRMNQDPEIAREVSLWDQRGSQVVRGALMVIPIDEALIYVQPLYLRAEGGRIHQLERVIVAYQNQVVMERTLEAGLARLFTGSGVLPPPQVAAADSVSAPTPTPTRTEALPNANLAALLRQATQHYDRAIAAQRAGNWAQYGAEIERLGAVLRQLQGGAPNGGRP
ncbi:MAG TPA: UPF0182 family protein [Gemmatimonadaceae bacterium]|nr:UPF0182 family protein [Gemmatimonadaceae bacterium]